MLNAGLLLARRCTTGEAACETVLVRVPGCEEPLEGIFFPLTDPELSEERVELDAEDLVWACIERGGAAADARIPLRVDLTSFLPAFVGVV